MQAHCHVSATTAKPDLCSHIGPVRAPVTLFHFPRADVSRFVPIDRARTFVPSLKKLARELASGNDPEHGRIES